MATVPPQSVDTAGAACLLEWLRARVAHGRRMMRAITDICVFDGATLDFLAEAAQICVHAHSDMRVAVACSDRAFARLAERHPRIAPSLRRDTALDSHTHAASPPRPCYDVVLLPFLRRDCLRTGMQRPVSSPAALLDGAARCVRPGGVILVLQPDERAGVFALRDAVRRASHAALASSLSWSGTWARLSAGLWGEDGGAHAETPASATGGARLLAQDVQTLVSAWQAQHTSGDASSKRARAGSATGGGLGMPAAVRVHVHSERLDSVVDVSDAVHHPESPTAYSIMGDLLDFDAELFAARESAGYKHLLATIRYSTLNNVSARQRSTSAPLETTGSAAVPVHAPFTLLAVLVEPSTPSPSPTCSVVQTAIPVLAGTTGPARASSTHDAVPGWSHLLHSWLPSPTPPTAPTSQSSAFDWSAVECTLRHPLLMPPLHVLHAVPGVLQREHDGALRVCMSQVRLARDLEVQPSATRTARAAGVAYPDSVLDQPVEVRTVETDRCAVRTDEWFPIGLSGHFFNRGLARWNEQRAAWTARPPGYTHPPYPPEIDFESFLEQIPENTARVDLPGPVRLPDMIELYQELWSPVEDDDSGSWEDEFA